MNKRMVISAAVIILFCIAGICKGEELHWQCISAEIVDVNAVWVDPDDPQRVYLVSDNGIFHSEDGGLSWSIFLRQKKIKKGYYSAFVRLPGGQLYLGTQEGLLISIDDGKNWNKVEGILGRAPVTAACVDKDGKFFVLSDSRVYQLDPVSMSYKKIVWKGYTQEDSSTQENCPDERSNEPGCARCLRNIAVDPQRSERIYSLFGPSVVKSEDGGKSWSVMPLLPGVDLKSISMSLSSKLYAVSKDRIFNFDAGVWRQVGSGLGVSDINAIAVDSRENIYLATGHGLFKSDPANDLISEVEIKDDNGDPTIQQVHAAAIAYADTDIEKIRQWRKQASKRAFLPKLEVSFDKDIDSTISSNTWGIYGNGTTQGRYYVGPDDRTNYRNNNYSVSLTWDLGDIVWSDAQTSIDVRSRLMVELRNDILDEVTRIYFERCKLKSELNDAGLTEAKIKEKKMRVQELAALLDGFTGGYFSQYRSAH